MKTLTLRSNLTLTAAVLLLAAVPAALAADPPSVPEDGWVVNGQVNAIVRTADAVYLGGAFTALGPNRPHGVPVDTTSGEPVAAYPKVNGTVRCCAPDGAGGWYIGGEFTQVGGFSRARLAHIQPNGTVDPAWNPNANNTVWTLALSGSTVYVGGAFTTITNYSVSSTRNRLAAIGTDGTLTDWNPNAGGTVQALAVSGSAVYVGGLFQTLGGTTRKRLAAVGTDGALADWNPNANNVVYALAVSGSTVYVGGTFTTLGDTITRNRLAAIGTDGTVAAWDPNVGGTVYALAVSGSTVYVGGQFTTLGDTITRNCLAAIGTDGALAAWNPGANFAVYALAVAGSTVYVGGALTTLGGATPRNHLAAIGTDGTVAAWNPNADASVVTLAVSGSTVYAGGTFKTLGGSPRNRLAAIGTDGTLAAWNPNADATVQALAVSGSTVYVGGAFTALGGTPRNRLAAIGTNGTLAAWDPNANDTVQALAVSGSTVYVGGAFTALGATPRKRLAAIGTDGALAAWDPSANDTVQTLVVSGSTVYVGGKFTELRISSEFNPPRNYLAAIGTDGTLNLTWDPNANGSVYALAVSGPTVYVGGMFTTLGGTTRNYLAAIGTDGALAAWDPNANEIVFALAVSGSTIYVGGAFTTIGGSTTRNCLAAIGTDGTLTAWDPNANTIVAALAVSDGGSPVYAGGSFTHIGGNACGYFAQFGASPVVTTTTLASSPNPSTYGSTVTFTATVSPSAASGTVTFKEGSTTLGTGTSSGGTATYATSALSLGRHSLTAEYAGDSSYAASTSDALTQTVKSGPVTWAPGGTYAWEMSDATGIKGVGWTWLDILGDLTVTATNKPDDSQKFTIIISGDGANFDNTKSNSWIIATASVAVSGFNANKFILTTNGFPHDLNSGTFSVLLQDKSVVLLFTPATPPPPCSDITTPTAAVEGVVMVMTFINASGLSSVQALVLDNCAITGRQYSESAAATNTGTAISGNIELNARNTLLGTTKKVVLWAAKVTPGEPAAVNVLALDTCGRGKSFDPVITTLTVTSGNRVQQRFAGLLSAERYLQVINGTPGLQWLEVNLNGHIFRLNPLAAGQSVAADLAPAMNEGDANVVVLTGYGDTGASALVLITDQPAGNLVQLPEVAELALALSGNRVAISWPEARAGWQLQASATLAGGWTDVPTTPMIANGYQTVSLAQRDQPQFFRLRKASGAAASAPTAASVKATGGTLSPTETLQPKKRTYDRLSW